MKKLLILSILLFAGLTTASLADHRHPSSVGHSIFISGYYSCGTPIYTKRIRCGNRYIHESLSPWESRRYLERQKRRAIEHSVRQRERYSRYSYHSRPIIRYSDRRRCR